MGSQNPNVSVVVPLFMMFPAADGVTRYVEPSIGCKWFRPAVMVSTSAFFFIHFFREGD